MENTEHNEQAVLGSMLLAEMAIEKAMAILQPEDFQSARHRQIYKVMIDMYELQMPVDIVSMSSELYNRQQYDEVGGRDYLIGMADMIRGEVINITHYAKMLRDTAIAEASRRLAINHVADIGKPGRNIIELISNYMLALSNLQARTSCTELLDMADIACNTQKELEAMAAGNIAAIDTGFPFLDSEIGGFYPGELITMAGLTGVGKTNFALQIADHIAVKSNIPVIFIPLEMVPNALFKRLALGRATKLTSWALRTGKLSPDQWTELSHISGELSKAKIYIPNNMDLKFSDIPAIVQRGKVEFGVRAVFIDYMQLINTATKFESGVAEQTYISRSLKMLARNHGMVVFSISQFRKLLGKASTPGIDDLKGSSAIPQDSDYIIFIHRDKEGDIMTDNGYIELAKGREAKTGYHDIIFKHPRFYPV